MDGDFHITVLLKIEAETKFGILTVVLVLVLGETVRSHIPIISRF